MASHSNKASVEPQKQQLPQLSAQPQQEVPEKAFVSVAALTDQRDAAQTVVMKLQAELEEKEKQLKGRHDNAKRLSELARDALDQTRRSHQSRSLILKRRLLRLAITLALASFSACSISALVALWLPLGGVLAFLPLAFLFAALGLGKSEKGESKLLQLLN